VLLPDACPRGGFRFGVQVGFADGDRRSAATVAGCPPVASAVARH